MEAEKLKKDKKIVEVIDRGHDFQDYSEAARKREKQKDWKNVKNLLE